MQYIFDQDGANVMKAFKVTICGFLLAAAAWMPSFATGLDEVDSITSDPYVAYTLHGDMSLTDAIKACDTLPGWTKKTEYIKDPNYDGPAPLSYTYTKTWEDKTRQVLTFKQYPEQTKLSVFTFTFYAQNTEDAMKMYEEAYHNIDTRQKWNKAGGLNTNYAVFWNDKKYAIQLVVNKDNKTFSITRYSYVIL